MRFVLTFVFGLMVILPANGQGELSAHTDLLYGTEVAFLAIEGQDEFSVFTEITENDNHFIDTSFKADSSVKLIDPWFGRDKFLHLSASALMTFTGQYFLMNKAGVSNKSAFAVSAGGAFAVGLAKEISDYKRKNFFSKRDLVADLAGIVLAGGIIFLIPDQ